MLEILESTELRHPLAKTAGDMRDFISTQEKPNYSAQFLKSTERQRRELSSIGRAAAATAALFATAISPIPPGATNSADFAAIRIFLPPYKNPQTAESHSEARSEMASYRELQDGWSGFESVSPNKRAINDALIFLRLIPVMAKSPESTVSDDGTVGWFWQTADAFISVHFSGDGRYAFYAKVKNIEARGPRAAYSESVPNDLLTAIMNV